MPANIRELKKLTNKNIYIMKIKELLKNIKPLEIVGDVDVDITGVNIDSRRIENGHLFVAMKGTQVDGHKFIGKAIELGAKAVLCEDMPTEKSENVTYIKVASTEEYSMATLRRSSSWLA